jgi:hypothetical protein
MAAWGFVGDWDDMECNLQAWMWFVGTEAGYRAHADISAGVLDRLKTRGCWGSARAVFNHILHLF